MNLYTFIRSSQWSTEFKQIASRLDSETVKKTYFNSFWECVTVFKLDDKEATKINENCYLFEYEVINENYEG